MLSVLLASVGCGKESVLAPALAAAEWELVAMGSSVLPSDPQLPTIRFVQVAVDRAAVMGRAPCNRYSGSYRLVGHGRLRLDGLSSTDMSCGAAADRFEAALFAYLAAVNRLEYRAGALVLITASHDELRFSARRAE